ncbi:peptidyl-prolyl isomerase [Alcanivorax hongdengensis A-11-3]|uniref:Peptidyl-prolyl cis-trans isomerase n=1 Tax=Alcanivorax hongdengensis A-11-3 TaxID=1177179 RepID=L0WF11_9GAMM|nr:FKBP-type peptidyl-prolyl cis-trans isomerase [Alcanivorax hongdengensis]EKF74757.1 peptidyl-prolyl isomerase [Alcanivorax hongdengensis A-11-3]
MKKFGVVLASTVLLAACGGQDKVTLKTDDQKASYALGFRSAEQMRSLENLNVDAMVAGLRDGFDKDGKSQLGDEDLDKLIRDFQGRVIKQQQAKMKEEAKANETASEKFLAENAKKDGVKTTDSGLQYQVLEEGKEGGVHPTLDDTVVVDYEGTLPDGKVFDSSIERGTPASFSLQHIIPGWQEALPMMTEGAKWRVVLPPKLAYGEQGAGGDIGPNQALVFQIQLLDVKGKGLEMPEPKGDDAAADADADSDAGDDAAE